MEKVLNRMMKASLTGSIEGWKEIEWILEKIGSLTYEKMRDMQGKEIADRQKVIAEILLNEEYGLNLEEKVIGVVEFTEVLCLIDCTKMSVEGCQSVIDWKKYCYRDVKRRAPFWYACIMNISQMFEQAQRKSSLFRMFWCINVEQMMECLKIHEFVRRREGVEEELPYEEMEDRFYEGADRLKINTASGKTIGDILESIINIRRECWMPFQAIEIYYEKILTCYELAGVLLLESFRYLHPEKFCQENILEKYRNQNYIGKFPQ